MWSPRRSLRCKCERARRATWPRCRGRRSTRLKYLNASRLSGLSPAEVAAVGRADLDQFAGLDEERDLNDQAGFGGGGLLDIAGGVALDAFRTFRDLEGDGRGDVDRDRDIADEKD